MQAYKCPLCDIWNKFFIRNVVVTVSWRTNSKIFPSRVFISCVFWRNVYQSALVPWKLLCLKKFLVARLPEEITLKSMSQTKENCDSLVLKRYYLWIIWRRYGILRVHRYYFCLEPMARKGTWIWTTSVTVTVCYAQSSFSKITSRIENNILKDTLQLNNLRTWINIRAKYFIKTLCNIMKKVKVPGKDKLHKNPSVHLGEHYT